MKNYFLRDPYSVILAWVQCCNISEKLMKVCSPLDFFQKNMSHEQLLLTWSTFRDSSMGPKLKIFEKLIKVCSPPEFFHKNMSHEQLIFTWSKFHDYAPEKTHALLTENLCSLPSSGVIIVLSHRGKLSWMKASGRRVPRNFDRDGQITTKPQHLYIQSPFF